MMRSFAWRDNCPAGPVVRGHQASVGRDVWYQADRARCPRRIAGAGAALGHPVVFVQAGPIPKAFMSRSNRRLLAGLLSVISAILIIEELRFLGVVNYRKMPPLERQWTLVAAVVFPFAAAAFVWGARRLWRGGDAT